jgi:hypothetical protein
LSHVQKDDATYCNVASVFPLGKTAPRLSIPLDYVNKGTSFAATPEPAPAAPPAAPLFPAKTSVKVVPAATTSATRAAAASAELAKRDKQARFETGQKEEAQVPLT